MLISSRRALLGMYSAVNMPIGRVLQFPMRNPDLFSPEINSQVLSSTKLSQVLYAAIQALPHVQDSRERENLRRALCDLLLPEDGVA